MYKKYLQKLVLARPELESKYKIAYLGIFGSYVRDQQTESSDLDVLVSFNKVPGLFTFIELENELSDLLDIKVDLVMEDALKKRIGERILQEVIWI